MKLSEVQQLAFRSFMRSSLDDSIQNELNYFLENVADYHFSDEQIESGDVRDRLQEEARLINITFADEWNSKLKWKLSQFPNPQCVQFWILWHSLKWDE